MKYYGVMCCELDGTLEDLECECEFKPAHEQSGLFFAKWFTDREKRDKIKEYLRDKIKEMQERIK